MTAKLIVAGLFLLALGTPAAAYVGPGAGIGVIGTALALLGTVVLLLVGFIWYPVKRFLRRNRSVDQNPADSEK